MPKYWGKNYFAHGSFPEVGQKQKTEREKKREKRGPTMEITMAKLRIGAHKYAWRMQVRMAHTSRLGLGQNTFIDSTLLQRLADWDWSSRLRPNGGHEKVLKQLFVLLGHWIKKEKSIC